MKRIDLIRYLESHGCKIFREGGNHSVYINSETQRSSAVPRHREVNDFLAKRFAAIFRYWNRRFQLFQNKFSLIVSSQLRPILLSVGCE